MSTEAKDALSIGITLKRNPFDQQVARSAACLSPPETKGETQTQKQQNGKPNAAMEATALSRDVVSSRVG